MFILVFVSRPVDENKRVGAKVQDRSQSASPTPLTFVVIIYLIPAEPSSEKDY